MKSIQQNYSHAVANFNFYMHLLNFISMPSLRSLKLVLGVVSEQDSTNRTHTCLLPRVAKGDEAAMRTCISTYSPLVWTIVKRRIHNEIDAAEVCQDVFTELWRVANRFDEKLSKESTYVGLLARRRSIDWQRKKSRLPDFTSLDHLYDQSFQENKLGSSIDHSAIWKLLKRLPTETFTLFCYHFEERDDTQRNFSETESWELSKQNCVEVS